jgi:hypothetical protein
MCEVKEMKARGGNGVAEIVSSTSVLYKTDKEVHV